jgi:AcrR family transcriptional regulator
VTGYTDPRITRTNLAFERAILELAAQQPVSRITVAELAERAGTTRATFYNRYGSPLELLVEVLSADLDRGHAVEVRRRARGDLSAPELLRLATDGVVDHVERFRPVYQRALGDPAGRGVHGALVRHFAGYSLAFIARCTHPGRPRANPELIAQFVANGFAGAITAWLGDDSISRQDLVDAVISCAPAWWR